MLFRSDRKSTRLNSSHTIISYAVFCLKKKKKNYIRPPPRTPHNASRLTTRAPPPRTLRRERVGWRSVELASGGVSSVIFFFFNDPATPEIYPLSLHDALPI